MLCSSEFNEVLAAVARARRKFGQIVADNKNQHFRSTYEDLNGILGAIRGPLSDEGVEILQPCVKGDAGEPWLQTRLVHYKTGQWIGSEMPLTGRGGAVGPQDLAAAITYQRRYTLKSLLSLEVEDDDDGNAAQGHNANRGRVGDPAPDRQDRGDDRRRSEPVRKPAGGGGGGIYGWARDRSEESGSDVVRFLDAYGRKKGFPQKLKDWPAEAVERGKEAAERWLDGDVEGQAQNGGRS